MDGKRFDNVTRAWATNGSRRRVIGGMLAAAIAGVLPKRVAAQDLGDEIRDSIASAGNGGVADASANGGAVSIGNINSGGNAGNAIGVGDTVGSVGVDGGTVGNVTDIGVTADGGTAIAPHNVVVDSQGRVYVTDRENQRIEVFDSDGKFLTEWKNTGGVSALALTNDGRIVTGAVLRDLNGNVLGDCLRRRDHTARRSTRRAISILPN